MSGMNLWELKEMKFSRKLPLVESEKTVAVWHGFRPSNEELNRIILEHNEFSAYRLETTYVMG